MPRTDGPKGGLETAPSAKRHGYHAAARGAAQQRIRGLLPQALRCAPMWHPGDSFLASGFSRWGPLGHRRGRMGPANLTGRPESSGLLAALALHLGTPCRWLCAARRRRQVPPMRAVRRAAPCCSGVAGCLAPTCKGRLCAVAHLPARGIDEQPSSVGRERRGQQDEGLLGSASGASVTTARVC